MGHDDLVTRDEVRLSLAGGRVVGTGLVVAAEVDLRALFPEELPRLEVPVRGEVSFAAPVVGGAVGGVEASAAPQGNVLRVVDEEQGCEVTLTFLGTRLVAHDNDECGGMNVRFDGVYQKR